MGDIVNKSNKRRVKGVNNSLNKSSLVEAKDLERSLREEISKEFINNRTNNTITNKNKN